LLVRKQTRGPTRLSGGESSRFLWEDDPAARAVSGMPVSEKIQRVAISP
jgi:hypothetical protein